jgi:hypothetical protein
MATKYIDMNAFDGRHYKGSIEINSKGVLSEIPCLVTRFLDGSKLELKLNLVPLPEFNGKKRFRFLLSVASSGNLLNERIICKF